MICSKRGAGLLDAMVSIFLLGAAGVVFSASFPTGLSALRQSGESSSAALIAQEKMEQIRSLDYAVLDYEGLRAGGVVDVNLTSSPYSFTVVDDLPSKLPGATGVLTISDETGVNPVKRVQVSISWQSRDGAPRSVTLITCVADSSPIVR